ncbi:ASCH domain-containing protein [Kroppenstedtia eburnea]|uniref:ASCH domain-containing protein n=1 Tax=Kroppenstedtia eburnea TaxID=714067 RepID=A0A1N7LGT2_9BACL|nr:ASCH domain-containing protein [Kroppenstedtia eburnea]EGK07749.1 hypothetical protein HMPREF9374_3585 [Desmospora sp. 8437]SIS73004.1 hypothetical protein SAMN05421790_104162 [Kroppenstedtia eburnea]
MDSTPYPEKTCSIDRLVTRAEDVNLVLAGEKTAQRRNGLYAVPGERLELGGVQFEVTRVYRQTLGEMTDEDARSEGQADRAAYIRYLDGIHPGIPWSPNIKMWVHEFRRLPSS